MRRVLVLVLLLAIIGVGAVFVLLSGGGESNGDGTPEGGTPGAQTTVERATPTPLPTVQVVVAVRPIPRGKLIGAEDVQVRFWPEAEYAIDPTIPESRPLDRVEDAIGSLARTDIPLFSPVFSTQLAASAQDLAAVGSDLATLISPERVAISVPLDPTGIGQVAYGLQPGDTVDIIMTFAFLDVDEFFQTRIPNTVSVMAVNAEGTLTFSPPQMGVAEERLFELDLLGLTEEGTVQRVVLPGAIGPSEQVQRPRLVTQRIVNGAIVRYIGWLPEDGRIYGVVPSPTPFEPTETPTPLGTAAQGGGGAGPQETTTPAPTASPYTPMIMVIELSPQDAVTVTWAVEYGIPITYALRSAAVEPGVALAPTAPVTLSYMILTYNLPDPNTLRLTYALEPRPLIRRFDLNTLRRFVELQSPDVVNLQSDPERIDLIRENLFIGASSE
jgi:Flp pilus assembly protein CpaB